MLCRTYIQNYIFFQLIYRTFLVHHKIKIFFRLKYFFFLGEKPWSCTYCSKSFLHKDTYKTHVRRHLNDRPFICKDCPRAFTEAWALKRHERTHSGIKPYTCEFCGKTFADSSNKTKHMRIHCAGRLQNDISKLSNMVTANVKYILSDNLLNPICGEPFDLKDPPPLLNIIDSEDKSKIQVTSDLHLTQLVDQQGNPISITTQDGQMVPVVTGMNDEASIQGLLPDGTLVPIELTAIQEKDLMEVSLRTKIYFLLRKCSDRSFTIYYR